MYSLCISFLLLWDKWPPNTAASKRKPSYVFSLTISAGQGSRSDLAGDSGSGSPLRLLSSQPELGSSEDSSGAKRPAFKMICSYCSSCLEASVFFSTGLLKCFHNMAASFLDRVAREYGGSHNVCYDLFRIPVWLLCHILFVRTKV